MSDSANKNVETDSDGTRSDTKVVEIDLVSNDGCAKSPAGSPKNRGEKGDLEELKRLLNQGKRQYLIKDYQASTDSLSESCAGFTKYYGDLAIECAEPLLLYAQSLLELARIESRVIDNGLEGVPVGEDCNNSQVEDPEKCTDEERLEVRKVVGEALEANFTELEDLANKKAEADEASKKTDADESSNKEDGKDGNTEDEEGGDSEPEDVEDADGEAPVGDGKVDPCEEATEDGVKADADGVANQTDSPDDDGNMTNIQLAWENADLAKAIYSKHLETLAEGSSERSDMEMKLCEALAVLGEVAVEDGNFTSAVDDLRACLDLRVKRLSDDSRAVAGSYFQLGEALSHDSKYTDAIESFKNAIDILKRRIANLKDGKITHDLGWVQDEAYSAEKEIAEIEILIPEIQNQMEETKTLQAEDKEGPVEMEEDQNSTDKENVEPVAKGLPSDVNHLVKKRKKSDEVGESEVVSKIEDPPKKLHLEQGDVASDA